MLDKFYESQGYQNIKETEQIYENFVIQIIGIPIFTGLFIALMIARCKRKIEDFYLKRSIWFLYIGITMRISMSLIIFTLMIFVASDHSNDNLMQLKLQILQFFLPYYFYMMVIVALVFSAHTFQSSLRKLLFP